MPVELRAAHAEDYDYCARLYFDAMTGIIRALGLDMDAQRRSLRQSWVPAQVRIITRRGLDIGWLQSTVLDDAVFLGQLYLDAAFRQQGIGTAVVRQIIGEAAADGRAVMLGVVKINPALRLHRRLGFTVTGEDEHKIYMRREAA